MRLPSDVVAAFERAPGRILGTRDLVALGHHRMTVAAWAADTHLERILHGLYRRADDPPPLDQGLHVAQRYLDLRRPAAHAEPLLSGGAALEVLLGSERRVHRPLVLVDGRTRPRLDELPFDVRRTLRVGALPPWCTVAGLRLVCPARGLADLAHDPAVTDVALRVAMDEIRNRRLLTTVELAERIGRGRGAGAARLRRVVDDGALEQESEGERTAFALLFGPRPPQPDCQVVCLGSLRVDFAFIAAGLVVEYHGDDAHRHRVDHDATRAHALERAGWRVIVVTATMLEDAASLAVWIHRIRREREQLIASGALRQPTLPPQPARLIPLRTLHPSG